MSIIYCEKHHRHYDSDFDEECPGCEEECEFCHGAGGWHSDAIDRDGNIEVGVGEWEKCICQI